MANFTHLTFSLLVFVFNIRYHILYFLPYTTLNAEPFFRSAFLHVFLKIFDIYKLYLVFIV